MHQKVPGKKEKSSSPNSIWCGCGWNKKSNFDFCFGEKQKWKWHFTKTNADVERKCTLFGHTPIWIQSRQEGWSKNIQGLLWFPKLCLRVSWAGNWFIWKHQPQSDSQGVLPFPNFNRTRLCLHCRRVCHSSLFPEGQSRPDEINTIYWTK